MKMSLKLTEEDISHCRQGSDIDLEAIFGGHISGKRTKGVKSNPIFNDRNHVTVKDGNLPYWDRNEDMSDGQLDIEVYSNIPTKINAELVSQVDITEYPEHTKSEMAVRQERESLKVTNGKDLVGDIVIENGYSNLAFEVDSVGGKMPDQLKELPQTHNCVKSDSVQEQMDYFLVRSSETLNKDESKVVNQSAVLVDNKVLSLNESEIEQKLDVTTKTDFGRSESDDIERSDTECTGISVLKEANQSSWPDLDDITVNVDDLNYEQQMFIENELNKKYLFGNSKPTDKADSMNNNQLIYSDQNLVLNSFHGKQKTDLMASSESLQLKSDSNSGKKSVSLSERKNSLPEMILHSLNDKPIKPILLTSLSVEEDANCRERLRSNGEDERKSVKFSEDTVFNENRPNKYRKEKVNLKDVYRGKITSNTAVATPNPLFVDDEGSLTDDEKAARYSRIMGNQDIDIIETKPRYDRLIKRTQAKQRRNKLIRLILAFLAFIVVIVVVVLLVIYFGKA